jgi:ribokinase
MRENTEIQNGETIVAKRPRIVVVGSVNTDMVVKGNRLPGPGETVSGGRFLLAGGGKGANQAVAAARLGAEVTLIAKVGRDMFGDQAVDNFRREGIQTDGILRDPEQHTGVALILVDRAGENLISVASGANHALTPDEITEAADRIERADVLMLQLETPIETVLQAARIAAKADVPVILNPAPAATLPAALLKCVTYLTPNETEVEQLTDIPVGDEASAQQAAERLLEMGVRHVIVTLGAKGARITSPSGTTLVGSTPVEAVDTTAAGDAFNGGLAWALANGMPLQQAVRQACLVGALSATRLGAQPSLPTRDEFETFVESVAG